MSIFGCAKKEKILFLSPMKEEVMRSILKIEPLSYHQKVREYIRKNEAKVWEFFSDETTRKKEVEEFKMALLKNTYRLENESNPIVYKALEKAKTGLDFNYKTTIYQDEAAQELNAGIVFVDDEAHIVLSGAVLSKLDENELAALFGHEISHALLWKIDNGEFETTSKIITSIANDYANDLRFHETARLFDLYTEIFCDKGALIVCGDKDVVISTLLKISTGLEKVSAKNYLKQAKEILSKETKGSDGFSHPENYIRALATEWIHDDPENAEANIEKIIEGKLDVEHLDLFHQEKVETFTRKFIQLLTVPKWFQTNEVEQLAKDYFKNFKFDKNVELTDDEIKMVKDSDELTKEYLSYVLMDFCMVDPELSAVPFAKAFELAGEINVAEFFEKIVIKELKLSKKKFGDIKKQWLEEVTKV